MREVGNPELRDKAEQVKAHSRNLRCVLLVDHRQAAGDQVDVADRFALNMSSADQFQNVSYNAHTCVPNEVRIAKRYSDVRIKRLIINIHEICYYLFIYLFIWQTLYH